MKQILTIITLLISLSSYGQLVRIDSTWSSKRIYHTNHIGYRIGTDSIRTKDVRATLDGGDTFYQRFDSLVSRTVYRFITMDSLSGFVPDDAARLQGQPGSYYLNRANHTGTLDTSSISGLGEFTEDRLNSKIEVSGGTKDYNDATGILTLTFTGGGGGGGLTEEQIRDLVGGLIRQGSGVTVINSDTGDSLLIKADPNAITSSIQRNILGKAYGCALPNGNALTFQGFQISTTGTATGNSISSSTPYRAQHKYEYLVTTASTTAVAGVRGGYDQFREGTDAHNGGFEYAISWGPATGVATSTARAFAGVRNSPSAPTDVNPSTLTEIAGMGYDGTDANIQVMYNDASGTCTKVDLGSGFPVPTADRTDFYTFYLSIASNGGTYYWKVVDESDGTTSTGSFNTNKPVNSSYLRPFAYTSAGGTSSVIGIGIFGIWFQIP